MEQLVKIKSIDHVTHDVLRIRYEKPDGFEYVPGQAADIAINKPEWKDTLSCFTFTSLPEDDFLEFTVKTYPSRNRVTNELLSAKAGDQLILHEPFGAIQYKGDGVFIAGGAGVTPFIAILKELEKEGKIANNKLLFANKSEADIIDKERFEKLLGDNFVNILSDEERQGYAHGFIDAEFIKKYGGDKKEQYYYICGPDPMLDAMQENLHALGVADDYIVTEDFG